MDRSRVLFFASAIVFSSCAGTGATPTISASAAASAEVRSSPAEQPANPTPVSIADPHASGATTATLATRRQSGPAYIQSYLGVYALPELPPNSTASFDDTPLLSIGYVLSGSVRWTWEGGSRELNAGEAAATPEVVFHQSNPGSTTTRWYTFVVYGGARTAFGALRRITQGVPLPTPQPEGSYTFRLDSLALEPHGRSGAVTHGGATAVVVLDGDVELRQPDTHDYLVAEQGVVLRIGAPMQVLNRGSSSAHVLEFFYTPDSQPFETPLSAPL
jgi:hypothetical protein